VEYQSASEEGLYEEQSHRTNRCLAGSIASWTRNEDPNENHKRECRANTGRSAVSKLDQRLDPRMVRQQSAIAKWPVGSAACTGTRSPDNRTP